MTKVTIIQPLIPKYSLDFFNKIADLDQNIKITVIADIKSKTTLNQFSEESAKFKAVHCEAKSLFGLIFEKGLHNKILETRPDIVVFSGNPRGFTQLISMIKLKLANKKFYAWGMFHRIGGPRFSSNLYYKALSSLVNSCLTYSRTGAQHLLSIGAPKNKIKILGTAIDEAIPLQEAKNTCDSRTREIINTHNLHGKKVILQVVRLSRIKKPELLIHAAEKILKKRSDVHFFLIGDGEMREEVSKLVHQMHIDEHVSLLGAIYDERELSHWYNIADVFAMPTCIGLSAHHAMCYGLPIVTDDSLDNQASEFDILYDGLNSIIYKEGDISDFAYRIEQIIDSPELAKFLSKNALHTVKDIHTLERKARNFIDAIKQ